MHPTAERNISLFFETYVLNENSSVAEIGSYDQHYHNKNYIPPNVKYTGIDISSGPNVDIVLEDPYSFPISDNTFDFIISTSVFEHSDFFWLTILEMVRVLKPNGLMYINAPSNGCVHRFPRDSWRFYPDSGLSLRDWIKRNGYNPSLMESFTSLQQEDCITFNDFVAVIIKDKSYALEYPNRILNKIETYQNGLMNDNENNYLNWEIYSEDHIKMIKQMGIWEQHKNDKNRYR